VWDIRKFNSPVKSFNNLPNKYMETDAKFSPDENIIFTGTSVFKNEGVGNLVFIDRKKLEIVKTLRKFSQVLGVNVHTNSAQLHPLQVLSACCGTKT
jgi:hypothetical protein